jgi:2-iminobutanoate/2-iminopropanoate deaminase
MTDQLRPILTPNATQPGGHYAQAMVHGDIVYVSGQLGFEPKSSTPELVSVEQQVRNCLSNLKAILDDAGSSMNHVIRTTVYISDVAFWPEVDHRPARTIVPCNTLHHGFQVEIDAMAALKT